ncbi:UNVERIFIED_CONTAM: hypothetical protein FKN15_043099 [Acipenser sinensis]
MFLIAVNVMLKIYKFSSSYMAQGSPSSKEEAGSQRGAKAGGEDEVYKGHFQAKQGEWMRWESVEQSKIGWQDL